MIKAKALTLCLAMLANASVVVSAQAMTVSAQPPIAYKQRQGALTETEMEMAKIAWRYFQNNYQVNLETHWLAK